PGWREGGGDGGHSTGPGKMGRRTRAPLCRTRERGRGGQGGGGKKSPPLPGGEGGRGRGEGGRGTGVEDHRETTGDFASRTPRTRTRGTWRTPRRTRAASRSRGRRR